MDFTAIDFETANHRRDSACQLAAVVVRGGQIVDEQKWMIRPRPLFFSPRNIEVHGIRPDDVEYEPEFGELWESIAPHVRGTCLVAHNAAFDIGVLMACIRAYGHKCPEFQFTCTRLIGRATWPGRSGYGLKPLAQSLGISFRHHDALEDSRACAGILLAAASSACCDSVETLELKYNLVRGIAGAGGYRGATRSRRVIRKVAAEVVADGVAEPAPRYETRAATPTVDLQRLFVRAQFLKPLAGKNVVFKGEWRRLPMTDAALVAVQFGATVHEHVTTQTHVVIVGGLVHQTSAPSERIASETFLTMTEDEFMGLV